MASDDGEQFEALDDLKRAWREGQAAKTVGPKDLDQGAKSTVDAATRRLAHKAKPRDPNQRGGATVNTVISRTEREEPETRFLERGPMLPIAAVRLPVASQTTTGGRTVHR